MSPPPTRVPATRGTSLAFWAVAVLVAAIHCAAFGRSVIDDAYITFTYSKHLAQGLGPVFTPGARVEATSSMLWAVLLTPFEWLRVGAPLAAKSIGLVCFVGSMGLAARLVGLVSAWEGAPHLPNAARIAAMLVAASSPLALWSFYGMEHGLVALLLLAGVTTFLIETRRRDGFASAIPIALLEAARPEGFMFVGLFAVARLVVFAVERPPRRWAAAWFACIACLLVPYELWGKLYYGHWLPNTVAAKVSADALARTWAGLRYAVGAYTWPWTLIVLAVAGRLLWRLRQLVSRRDRANLRALLPRTLITAVCLLQLAFAVEAGGDWMPDARFLSHVVALVVVLMVLSLGDLPPQQSGRAGLASRLLAIAVMSVFAWVNATATYDAGRYVAGLEKAEEGAIKGMALFLNDHARAGDTVACSDIGRMGYYFKGRVLDWWGLADEAIARSGEAIGRVRVESVLAHRPRYIVLYSTEPILSGATMSRNMATYSRPFWDSAEFRTEYLPVLALYFWKDRYHILFERRRGA